jgi:ketopantoate reductase
MARDAKSRVGGRSSMLQDVTKGRRAEINYLNGYVSEQGRQVGVKTPFNDKIAELVDAPGVGLLTPDPKYREPLWAMVPH